VQAVAREYAETGRIGVPPLLAESAP